MSKVCTYKLSAHQRLGSKCVLKQEISVDQWIHRFRTWHKNTPPSASFPLCLPMGRRSVAKCRYVLSRSQQCFKVNIILPICWRYNSDAWMMRSSLLLPDSSRSFTTWWTPQNFATSRLEWCLPIPFLLCLPLHYAFFFFFWEGEGAFVVARSSWGSSARRLRQHDAHVTIIKLGYVSDGVVTNIPNSVECQ